MHEEPGGQSSHHRVRGELPGQEEGQDRGAVCQAAILQTGVVHDRVGRGEISLSLVLAARVSGLVLLYAVAGVLLFIGFYGVVGWGVVFLLLFFGVCVWGVYVVVRRM